MAPSKAYSTLPPSTNIEPSSFELHIPQQQIDDFKTLLHLSPIAKETYENSQTDRRYGVPRQWIVDAKKHWLEVYDWRKTEEYINSFPNFKSTVTDDDGKTYDIHFTSLFSEKKDAIPLALFHGWPGSILEFLPLLDLLRQKYTPETLPYHVIVPSLPGYGLSSDAQPPVDAERSWAYADIARIMHKLLTSNLGFGSNSPAGGYVVQGGDIGSSVARTMAATYPECKACHLNLNFMGEPPGISSSTYTPAEIEALALFEKFKREGNAYGRMHATRPSTIGLALSSSPLALLSWISEKFLAWSDVDPPLSTILSNVSLYWFTNCFPSAIYTYKADFESSDPGFFHGQKSMYIHKPFGFSWFPKDLASVPRAWVEKTGDLVFFRAHERGGHFAAMERPEAFLGDLEEFVRVAGV